MTHVTTWKKFEGRVCALFGCKRRGADYRDEHGGKDDGTSDRWAIECKLLARPTYGQMLEACKQAEAAANGREPVAVVKRKHAEDNDALVVMRLETFKQWRLW